MVPSVAWTLSLISFAIFEILPKVCSARVSVAISTVLGTNLTKSRAHLPIFAGSATAPVTISDAVPRVFLATAFGKSRSAALNALRTLFTVLIMGLWTSALAFSTLPELNGAASVLAFNTSPALFADPENGFSSVFIASPLSRNIKCFSLNIF